jgi:hypothetical protein
MSDTGPKGNNYILYKGNEWVILGQKEMNDTSKNK